MSADLTIGRYAADVCWMCSVYRHEVRHPLMALARMGTAATSI